MAYLDSTHYINPIQKGPISPTFLNPNILHQAQEEAIKEVFDAHFFSPSSDEYIQSQDGLKQKVLLLYSQVYDGVSSGLYAIASTVKYVSLGILSVGNKSLGWAINPLLDAVFPVSPINGHRHFIGISRSFEKKLGAWLFYPLATTGMVKTSQLLSGTNETIAQKVSTVFDRLKDANKELLNPENETVQFDYQVTTVRSSSMNAFAVPGGNMVVFSQLVKELHGAITAKQIKDATVHFADGSTATINLSEVTLDDALAALIGHEMTHIAARHSIISLSINFMLSIVLGMGRMFLIHSFKSNDQEYQRLKQIPQSKVTLDQARELNKFENYYADLNISLGWLQDKGKKLISLFQSKRHEYEADITGMHFASQAEFNPLGALYLQEFLNQQSQQSGLDFLHKNFEFMFTHPYGEKRKQAIAAALKIIHPNALQMP